MYLRNKKTGEVVDWSFVGPTAIKEYEGKDVLLERERYESIEEFISEWEDYKPAEPLIKDEKIRKAVRAWAEACGVEEYVSVSDLSPAFTRFYTNEYEIDIKTENSLRLSEREYYTIAELCGDEE